MWRDPCGFESRPEHQFRSDPSGIFFARLRRLTDKPLTIISILSFGALMLLGLMGFVYGFLGADPHGASFLPWVAR